MMTLRDVLKKYSVHPEFLGVELIDPNQRGAVDDTPLHLAARTAELEDVEVLLENGAKINIAGDLGNTALHQAAMGGKLDAVRLLLSHGANPHLKNEFGQTALQVAELGGYVKVVEALKNAEGAARD